MGLQLQHHPFELAVVGLGEVVLALELQLLLLQLSPVGSLRLGLQGVEDGGAHQQVGEGADDQGQSPDVLPLHGPAELGETRVAAAAAADGCWGAPREAGADAAATSAAEKEAAVAWLMAAAPAPAAAAEAPAAAVLGKAVRSAGSTRRSAPKGEGEGEVRELSFQHHLHRNPAPPSSLPPPPPSLIRTTGLDWPGRLDGGLLQIRL